ITGMQLNEMSPAEFKQAALNHSIFARVDPEHKYKIVEALQSAGHIVAVTGDGVNDAPAIKRADIGIAMGIKGTDVAKEASDMVLRDDNFATIVSAVDLGRTIFQNLQGFVRYLLAANVVEVMVVSLGFFFGLGEVVTPIQLLWINLATDALPALALGEDPAAKDNMKRKPRARGEGVLTNMGSFITVSGIIGTIVILGAYVYGLQYGTEYAQTMAFTTIVVYELVLVFNSRQEGKSWLEVSPFTNKWLVIAVLASFGLQLLAVYLPVLDPIFGTKELLFQDWGVILLASLSATLVPYLNRIWIVLARKNKEKNEHEYIQQAWPATPNH
ncbi:MAG: HAD-IC family P-type ATPase, partial [archaeon]